MKKIIISHLVTNGCSFTYGDGLARPSTQAWPALLAKKIGVPVANIAMGGTSNDRIYRKTLDYVVNDYGSNPFHIMGLTSFTRREEYNKNGPEWLPLNILSNRTDDAWDSKLEALLLKEIDWVPLARRKLGIWSAIINLFRANDINYLIVDMIPIDHILTTEVQEAYPKLYEYVSNDINFVRDYLEFNRPLPKLPCGHDDAVAQIAIADYLYNEIMSRYEVTIAPKHDHLSIKEFYTENETAWAIGHNRADWII